MLASLLLVAEYLAVAVGSLEERRDTFIIQIHSLRKNDERFNLEDVGGRGELGGCLILRLNHPEACFITSFYGYF
jgi:hypothetical protein